MKKILIILAIFLLAAAGLYAKDLTLSEVISQSARDVEEALKEQTTVAVVNFISPSEEFSNYVIEELTGALVNGKRIVIVDRRNLDLIREEMNLQLSGDVSDESMLSIGKQLGAHYIVSGTLTNMGKYYRFRIKVISVETTVIQTQNSLNLKNDSQVNSLITDGSESFSESDSALSYRKQKWALGVGMEYNMNSTMDFAAAFGMNFGFDYNISSLFAFGIKESLSYSDIFAFETTGLFRWYIIKNLFLQADAGLWMGLGEKDEDFRFLIGARSGVRLPVSRNFYFEPYVRVGYPFMFGAGLAGGFRFPSIKSGDPIGGMTPRGRGTGKTSETKEATFAEQVTAIVQEYKDERIWLEFDSDGRLRLMVSVVFSANSTEFEGLSPEIMASNERTLKYVSDILKRTKYSSIIIEGHSNPTNPPGAARDREENELKLLSRLRALTVVDELRKYGVNLDRRSVQGAGSSRLVAPYNDAQNNWKNRRVEFILIQ
jgi:outer membrane protein OmpA-like peptidoglycan-associated protein/TolB-like protein